MNPYYEDDYCTIYHGDCREVLPELGKVDLVLTDPPYGIDGSWSGGNSSGWGKHKGEAEKWDERLNWLVSMIAGFDCECIVFGGQPAWMRH